MGFQEASIKLTKKAYWVEFIGDRSIKVEEGQTILDASLKAGIPHYHECGGNGECSTCRVLIQHGSNYVSPPSEREKALKETIPFPPNVRLACQTFITGNPVHLHRIIRDDTDLRLYISKNGESDQMNSAFEKEMALFFLDIRDFTPFMQTYLPFDVIHIMRRLFSLFRKAIEENNGRIIETEGDGFYAAFGFETTIIRAVNDSYTAAKTILNELNEFNDKYAEKHFFHQFRVGIGLHAGHVIVGNIGIGVNNSLTVMGLPVNIASRIQGVTKSLNNDWIVSDHFYTMLEQKPLATKMQTELKGIKESQTLHLCGKPYG